MEALPAYFTGILALLLVSSFVKIVTTLSIVRFGIGLHGAGMGLVVVALSLALSLLVMDPQLRSRGGFVGAIESVHQNGIGELERTFRPFLEANTDTGVLERFAGIAQEFEKSPEPVTDSTDAPDRPVQAQQTAPGFAPLVSAFLVTELKIAFQLGFLILVPFLVVDLLVTNVLLALGVVQISQAVVAVPLKILLFFALDGWFLISERLLGTYA